MTSSSALPPPTGRSRKGHYWCSGNVLLQVHPLLGAWGGGDGAAGSWGCLFLLPSGMRLSHPAPARSRDLPCGYIEDSYRLSGVVVLSRPSIWLDIHFISLRKKLLDFLQACGACLLPTIAPPCGHSELSTWSRALKFLSVGMLRIFYFT